MALTNIVYGRGGKPRDNEQLAVEPKQPGYKRINQENKCKTAPLDQRGGPSKRGRASCGSGGNGDTNWSRDIMNRGADRYSIVYTICPASGW